MAGFAYLRSWVQSLVPQKEKQPNKQYQQKVVENMDLSHMYTHTHTHTPICHTFVIHIFTLSSCSAILLTSTRLTPVYMHQEPE